MPKGKKRAKRNLFSPDSAEKVPKKFKPKENSLDVSNCSDIVSGLNNSLIECGDEKTTTMDACDIHEIVARKVHDALKAFQTTDSKSEDPLTRLLPTLVTTLATAVAVAVEEAVKGLLNTVEQRLASAASASAISATATSVGPLNQQLVASVRRLTYENDALQQYSRRESVRIFGLPRESNESQEAVEKKVLRVIRDAGVSITSNDFSAVHRVGKPNSAGPVLVKFVSRKKRSELMASKKSLKSKSGYAKIYINDDLTPLRHRLLMHCKSMVAVHKAWSVGGRIHCQMKTTTEQQQPKVVVVESPDDLFKLGADSVDYSKLGLGHLCFGDVVADAGVGADADGAGDAAALKGWGAAGGGATYAGALTGSSGDDTMG